MSSVLVPSDVLGPARLQVVLRNVHDEEAMAGWRATQDFLQSTALRPNGKLVRTNPSSKRTLESRIHWFDNVLERAPEQMWPAVAHPRILDAVEEAHESRDRYCHACFSGTYPVPVETGVVKEENDW